MRTHPSHNLNGMTRSATPTRDPRRAAQSPTPIYDQLITERGDPHIPPISLEPPKLLKAGPLGYLPPAAPALPAARKPAPARVRRG